MRTIVKAFVTVVIIFHVTILQLTAPQAQESLDKPIRIMYGNTSGWDIRADAPWRVCSASQTIPIMIYVKDCDQDQENIRFEVEEIIIKNYSRPIHYESINEVIDYSPFIHVISVYNAHDLGVLAEGGTVDILVEVNCKEFDIKNQISNQFTFKQRLRVYVGEKLPSIPNWYPGDTHFHSDFTDSTMEWGAGLLKGIHYNGDAIVKIMGKAIGLKWVTVTDHSCDFGDDNFISPSGGQIDQWNKMVNKCRNNSDSNFRIIPAEEVTVGRIGKANRLHLLAYGTNSYIDGPEVAIQLIPPLWVPIGGNVDHWGLHFISLRDALSEITQNFGFSYAAHPKSKLDIMPMHFTQVNTICSIYGYGRLPENNHGI